jgi:hypothetical protein
MKYIVTNTDLAYGDKKNENQLYPEGTIVDLDPKEKEVNRLVESGILVPAPEEKK